MARDHQQRPDGTGVNAPLDPLMTPAEVADLFRVHPKTVGRWADEGRIRIAKTPGGHRRFYASDIRAMLDPTED